MRVTIKVELSNEMGVDIAVEREIETFVPDMVGTWPIFSREGVMHLEKKIRADLHNMFNSDAPAATDAGPRLWIEAS